MNSVAPERLPPVTAAVRRWIDAGWPFALLLLFIVSFRSTTRDAATASGTACEGSRSVDVATLERCLALEPDDAELMTDLGDRYRTAGNDAGAEALYRRALAVDARNGDVHRRLGELLLARGDAAAARAEGEAALATQPNSLADAELIQRADDRARSGR